MKKLLYLSLFIIVTSSLEAQEIVDDNKQWSVLVGRCLPDYTTYSTSFYRFNNDTIIDDNLYQMVFISEDEFQEEWFFFGSFIREENKKVYYREYFGEEGLIYDFNLQLGDTVVVDNPIAASEVTLVLSEVDSVETLDGYRERWKLTNDDFLIPEYWIKGIGSTAGVLNSSTEIFGGLCGSYILLCQEENKNTIYLNPDYEHCYYTLLDDDNKLFAKEETYKIIYRPLIQKVKLVFDQAEMRTVFISDMQGRLINKATTTQINVELSFKGKNKGLYVVSVLQKNGELISKKLIVN